LSIAEILVRLLGESRKMTDFHRIPNH
jgi:hypothetical protein